MSRARKLALSLALLATVPACAPGGAPPETIPSGALDLPRAQRENQWFADGRAAVERARLRKIDRARGAARNVILFVGDGMSLGTVTAARILAGQQRGLAGEEYVLSFETMPFAGLAKTYNTNQQTPDSAGTMTAMMTGVKTRAGVINLPEDVPRGDCAASRGRGLVTALELAEARGKSTGIVSTSRLTHATPAATYARSPERGWEYRAPEPCRDIASQMIGLQAGDGIDVMLGGGRAAFLPRETTDLEGARGWRPDGRDLAAEWRGRYDDGVTRAIYVEDRVGFEAVETVATDKLFGLFDASHMRYEFDRENDSAGEPSLAEMTAKALDLLQRDEDGFFLMVEGGRIDHGHHLGNAYVALTDTVEFAEAVGVAMERTSEDDTLIIVTADHGHVMTFGGYPTRGNPILGKVVGNDDRGEPEDAPELARDGLPYTTLAYANGRGFAMLEEGVDPDVRWETEIDAGRKDLRGVDTTDPGFHQEALVPMGGESHGGEDVPVWARGPGAQLIGGTIEQSVIFHVMVHAAALSPP